ncbi:MAG: hypothetical protein WBA13_08535 [Microcoleaceae cyanobacterium]
MFEPHHKTEPKLTWILCILLLSEVFLIPLVNLIQIPLNDSPHGIISLAYIYHLSPYTDYIKYIILLLTPALLSLILINCSSQVLDKVITFIIKIIHNKNVWIVVTTLLIIAWLINTPFSQFLIDDILIDSFHQGEFLGFLPNFLQLKNPWVNTVLIHGWGIDVFPSWIATHLIFNQNGIALTRFWVNLENVITCIGYFWILWELTNTLQQDKPRLPIFLLSCLVFCIFDGIFFKFDGRRGTIFIWQLALMLRFFRIALIKPNQAMIISVMLGASLPASFLYVYDRAIYFIAVYCFATVLVLFQRLKKLTKIWFIGSIIGVILSSITLSWLLGVDVVVEIISQVSYWGKYGRYISFIPLPALEFTWVSCLFWWPILIQSAVIIYLLLDFKTDRRQLHYFIQKNTLILILLIASLVYMRITLDRSDIGHAYHGAIPTVFLTVYLIYLGYQKYLYPKLQQISFDAIQKLCIAIFIILLMLTESGFNLGKATAKIIQFPEAISQADTALLKPDYLEAWQTMKPEISQQSCFFTLTSEGLWYYLFDKPSCSRYSYLLYAKPIEAQKRVIQELEETQPNLILFTNEMWFQNPWDEILKAESASQIYQYALQNYQPYKAVQSHWFWQRSEQPITFNLANLAEGSIDFAPTKPLQRGDNISLMGWAILPQKQIAADAVYLSFGEQNQLVNASPVNIKRQDVASAFSEPNYQKSGWTIQVPTAILPEGETVVKVWAYDAEANQLFLMGSEIIKVSTAS